MSTRRSLPLLVLLVLAFCAVGLSAMRDNVYGELQPADSVLYIRSGTFLERASMSNASLLADIYWVRAIQYYGGLRREHGKQKSYKLLYPLLDIVTTLDPHFSIAYRFGAVFLAERYPGGPGRPDLSIALLDKGLRADPSKWQYDLDEGFVYYWYFHDYEKAAAAFKRGGDRPGAPSWLRPLAAATFGKGGDRQSSRLLWRQLYETADNDWLRNNAQVRLLQLDALDEIDQLQKVIGAFERRAGRTPPSWLSLVQTGWLRGIPVDPTGVPFVLDPATGRVNVSTNSKLSPLPTETGAWIPPPPE